MYAIKPHFKTVGAFSLSELIENASKKPSKRNPNMPELVKCTKRGHVLALVPTGLQVFGATYNAVMTPTGLAEVAPDCTVLVTDLGTVVLENVVFSQMFTPTSSLDPDYS